MLKSSSGDMAGLLQAWSDGDRDTFDRLTPIVYDKLRRPARRSLRCECTL